MQKTIELNGTLAEVCLKVLKLLDVSDLGKDVSLSLYVYDEPKKYTEEEFNKMMQPIWKSVEDRWKGVDVDKYIGELRGYDYDDETTEDSTPSGND